MINDKIETINKMYYSSLVYTNFLLNTIYGFPQDNIKNYILDDELLDTASLLFSSNILFTFSLHTSQLRRVSNSCRDDIRSFR